MPEQIGISATGGGETVSDTTPATEVTQDENASESSAGEQQDENASESSAGETESSDGEGSEKVKATNGVQKRINELTGKVYEANSRAEALAAQLAAMQQDAAKVAETAPTPPDPDLQFTDPAKYRESHDRYISHVAAQATLQEQRRLKQMEIVAERTKSVKKSVDETRAAYKDYDEALTRLSPFMDETTAQILAESDHPGPIAYYLGKNPMEASKLLGMSPAKRAMFIGTLDSKVANRPLKKTTSAPPPVRAVKGGGRVEKPTSQMTTSEFMEFRKAQAKNK